MNGVIRAARKVAALMTDTASYRTCYDGQECISELRTVAYQLEAAGNPRAQEAFEAVGKAQRAANEQIFDSQGYIRSSWSWGQRG